VALSDTAFITGGSGAGVGIYTFSASGTSGQITVGSGTTVEAFSDRAILDVDGATTITNDGTITGYVELGDGADIFTNSSFNSLNLRNFADTTGNGIRDIEGAAINDFGAAVDTFTNTSTGAVRLMTVSAGAGDMFGDRIEQASFINLENFNNAGLISMWETDGGAAQAGDLITITNGGTGVFTSNGGMLQLDTVLNDDASATDQLVLDNSRLGSGATGVRIMNAGGAGAATVADGIKIVDVTGGTSDAGAFALAERTFAGAYEYLLFQNGVTDPSDGDWYLRSAYSVPSAVYESAPSILLGGFTDMATLEQRVGQRQWSGRDSQTQGPLQPSRGAWLRFTGDKTNLTPENSTAGASYSSTTWGLQAGVDAAPIVGDNGQWVLGVTAQYGQMKSSVSNTLGFGNIDSKGYGVGATATWYGNAGTYVDLQGQVNWLKSDISTAANGVLVEGASSTAYALSAEVGHRVALNANSALVPQAQLTWGRLNGGSFTDRMGNAVDFGTNDRLVGRIGLAYEYEYSEGWLFGDRAGSEHQNHREKVYVIGNLIHDFSGASTVTVAGTDLSASNNETWAEVGIGGSITWDQNKTLFTEASYSKQLSGGSANKNEAFNVTAGLRFQF